MNKLLCLTINSLLFISFLHNQINAELSEPGLINLNPDSNGEPWFAGGTDLKQWQEAFADAVKWQIPERGALARRAAIPSSVNNTTDPAFRPVFNQLGGSCAQASGVAYLYTYEVNCQRGLSSDVLQNQYPYDFTYNFLNDGNGNNGTNSNNGWKIIQSIGIPNAQDYGGFGLGEHTRWVSGYEVYFKGMENRLKEYFSITIRKPEDIEELKQYLFDRGTGSAQGGCVVFAADANGEQVIKLDSETPEGGKSALVKFGSGGGHAMTIAGFNDQIRYDYNSDGEYTNTIDLNNDGLIDVRDWEIGAALLVNSWGSRWGNSGKCYIMYKVLADPGNNGGIYNNRLFGINLFDDQIIKPKLTFKLTISHTDRSNIRIRGGLSNNVSALTPSFTTAFSNAFSYSGGTFPMQGTSNEPLEIGLDLSDLLERATGSEAAFFLQIESRSGTGIVQNLSIIDYTGDKPIEYPYSETDITIPTGTTNLKIVKPATPILIVTPNDSVRWERGRSYEISWVTNIDDSVKIELLKGDSLYSTLENCIPNNGTYNWMIREDQELSSDYSIRVSSVINPAKTDKSDHPFTVEENSTFEITSPNGGEMLETGSNVNITWNIATTSTIKIDLYRDNIFLQNIADDITESNSYSWSIPLKINSGYDFKIRVSTKESEPRYDESDSNFIIMHQPKEAPYVQTFDSLGDTLNDSWEQIADDDLNWKITNGLTTQSDSTGPHTDHTSGIGNYVYVGSSSSNISEKEATLLSPLIDIRIAQNKVCSFWIHMNSSENKTGKLHLDVNAGGVWNNDVLLVTGDHGDIWFIQALSLASYNADFIQVRFRAQTGNDFDSYICIDDFQVGGDVTLTLQKKTKLPMQVFYRNHSIQFRNYEGSAKIVSLNGAVISNYNKIKHGSIIDISSLKSGTYLLLVNSGSKRFIKTER